MTLSIWKKTSKDRNCLIKIDDSVWGTLSEKVLRTLFHYHIGSLEITESEAIVIKDELTRTAWNNLLNWLARQEHSINESRDYLHRQKFHASIIDQCLKEALSKQFIDDSRYCRLLVESLIQKGKSPVQIKGKMIEKHLPSSLWEPILAELYQPAEARDILREQAQKTYLKFRQLDKRECYEKCVISLYRKGFDLDEVREAVAALVYRRA